MPDASTPNRRCLCSASGAGSATRARLVCVMGCCCLRSSFKAPFASSSKAPSRVVLLRPSPTPAGEKEMAAKETSPSVHRRPADTEAGPRRACSSAASKRSAKRASDLPGYYKQAYPSTSNICRLPRHAQNQTAHRSKNSGIKRGRRTPL